MNCEAPRQCETTGQVPDDDAATQQYTGITEDATNKVNVSSIPLNQAQIDASV